MYSQIKGNRGVTQAINAPEGLWHADILQLVECFKLLLATDLLRNLSASFAMKCVSIK